MKTVARPGAAAIADMNGPLVYWGPSFPPAATHNVAVVSLSTDVEIDALARLQRTLHGRTWSGTHALMNALFAAADEDRLVTRASAERV